MAHAQSAILDLPRASQHAVVTQRIGITDVTINYHRPVVNKRKIWGGIVPYGDVWRAGANENTTIAFTDPVSVESIALVRKLAQNYFQTGSFGMSHTESQLQFFLGHSAMIPNAIPGITSAGMNADGMVTPKKVGSNGRPRRSAPSSQPRYQSGCAGTVATHGRNGP
jgi:hypothetical protein